MRVFAVAVLVSLFVVVGIAQPQVNLLGTDMRVGVATGGAVSTPFDFLVDTSTNGGDVIDLAISASGITISIVRPDGVEVTTANAAGLGFSYMIAADGAFATAGTPLPIFSQAGTHVVIGFGSGQPSGTYHVKADATGVATDTLVIGTYVSSSNIRAGILTQPNYKTGDSVVLTGFVVEAAAAVNNATVTAKIASPQKLTAVSIGNYQLISQTIIDAATTQYEYQATATNGGTAASGVTARMVSPDPSILVVSGTLSFGGLPALGQVASANTFIIQAPTGTFSPSSLQWIVSAPGVPASVTLTDSGPFDFAPGDGAYSGVFVPTAAGEYTATVLISGTSSTGVPFSRCASTTFTVSDPTAQIASITDALVDDNGNGLADRLVVTVNANVTLAGAYFASLQLTASNGNVATAFTRASLSSGSAQLQLTFPAQTLIGMAADGPYQRQQLILAYEQGQSIQLADSRADAGNTQSVLLSSLDRGPLYFTGQNSASGVITGAGPTFDLLRVQVGVSTASADTCSLGAELADSSGNLVASAQSTVALNVGNNTMTLDFNGVRIAQSAGGPYIVQNAGIICTTTEAHASPLFTISGFPPSQFTYVARDFNLSLTGPPPSGLGGATLVFPLQLTSTGAFDDSVAFGVTGLPDGATGSFTVPAIAGNGPQILSVATTSSLAVGTYPFSVGYATGTITKTLALSLNITPPPTAVPAFSPAPGTYASTQTVTISSATAGASIRYTIDGSTPSETAGTLYAAPIPVNTNTTIKAIAYAQGLADSAVSVGDYAINLPTAAAPTFNPAGGTYTTAQVVSLATVTTGASIRYTTDGTTPNDIAGTLYSGPIALNSTTTIKAVAFGTNLLNSAVSSATYTINLQAAAPVFSPGGGSYTAPQSVSITTTTSGASIRYTTDGTTPTETVGMLYTGPVQVSSSMQLKAIAYAAGMSNSAVSAGTYTINLPTAATPSFTPAAGTYAAPQSVTITSGTSGTSIRYTTDGTSPTETAGTLYTGAISVNTSTTIKAIAYASGMLDSNVASAAYAIGNLPAGWIDADIGNPSNAGSASFSGNTFTVRGGGVGTPASDRLNFIYQAITGDTTMIARIANLQGGASTAKVGIMIRETLDPASAMAFVEMRGGTPQATPFLLTRSSAGASIVGASGSQIAFPQWVKITRQGTTFGGFSSVDGINWTQIGSVAIPMAASAFAGIAVTSDDTTGLATATVDNVTVAGAGPDFYLVPTPIQRIVSSSTAATDYRTVKLIPLNSFADTTTFSASGLPAGASISFSPSSLTGSGFINVRINLPANLVDGDYPVTITAVGTVARSTTLKITASSSTASLGSLIAADDLGSGLTAGSSVISGNAVTIQAAGSNVGGTSESFRFTYQSLDGDGTVIARVTQWDNFFDGATMGVMIRENLSPNAANVCMCLTGDVFGGIGSTIPTFQYRSAPGADTTKVQTAAVGFPLWFKLTRVGSQFSGFTSTDGVTWQQLGSTVTVNMANSVFMGIALSSNSTSLTTGHFTDFHPLSGPDFYLSATPDSRAANPGPSSASYIILAPSFNGFSAPVTLSISGLPSGISGIFASGSASGNMFDILRLDIAAGTAPGTYTGSVTGTSGTITHSIPVAVSVNSTATDGIPSPWSLEYIGSETSSTPPPAYSNGTFTLGGSGCCIDQAPDSLAFVYQGLTGDGNVTARVTSSSSNGVSVLGGVMLRETTAPSSRFAFAAYRPIGPAANGYYRANPGDLVSNGPTGADATPPVWLKLVRQGSLIAQYSSSDNINWTQLSLNALPMNPTLLAGIAISGPFGGSSSSMTFDNVSIDHTSDFLLGMSPATLLVAPGASVQTTLSAFPTGSFTGTVAWTATNVPAGVTVAFDPNSTSLSSATTVTLSASAGATLGSYSITLTGTSGSVAHSIVLPITVAPDFAVAITPSTQTIWKGSSITYTVTVTPLGGFSGTVNLSAVGTVNSEGSLVVSPSQIDGASGTATVTASINSNASTFSKTVFVNATSGSITHQAGATLLVGPEFHVSAPGTITLDPGSSATPSIGVLPLGGFEAPVTLSISNLPAGASGSFNPATLPNTSSTSTLTISTSASTSGSTPVVIQGTGGGITRSFTTTIAMRDFSFDNVTPSTQTVVAGGTTSNYSVLLLLNNGYSGTITFGTSGLPSGATPHFSLGTRSSNGFTNLTIQTTTAVAAGTYPFTITGTNTATGLQRTIPATLIVTADFSISASANTVTVTAGSSGPDTITITPIGGFTGAVSFSLSGLPTDAGGSFNPSPLSVNGAAASSILTLSTAATIPGGSSTVTITATSGGLTHTKTITLTVKNYFLSVSAPTSQTVAAGASTTYTVNMAVSGGFSSTVTFGTAGLPAGVTPAFSPTTRSTAGTTTLTLSTTGSVATGTYPFTITGSCSGCPAQSTPATLVVTDGFSVATSAGTLTVTAGQNGTLTTTLAATAGLSESTALTITGLPAGASADFAPTSVTGTGSSTLTITTTAATPGGNSTLTITGTNGSLTRSATVTLTVKSFTLSASPTSLTVTHGGAGKTVTITLTMTGGFASTVTFGTTGKPTGVTAGFSPTSRTSSGTSTLTITAGSGTATGTYNMTITGTNGSLVESTPFTLIVN